MALNKNKHIKKSGKNCTNMHLVIPSQAAQACVGDSSHWVARQETKQGCICVGVLKNKENSNIVIYTM